MLTKEDYLKCRHHKIVEHEPYLGVFPILSMFCKVKNRDIVPADCIGCKDRK